MNEEYQCPELFEWLKQGKRIFPPNSSSPHAVFLPASVFEFSGF